jgi:N-acetylmuramoyl-L-alanine amidase
MSDSSEKHVVLSLGQYSSRLYVHQGAAELVLTVRHDGDAKPVVLALMKDLVYLAAERLRREP